MYKPTYMEEFRRLNPDPRKMDARKERLAVDVLIDEKEKELKQDPRAIQWEADRKREWKAFRKQKKLEEQLHQAQVERAKIQLAHFLKKRVEGRKGKHDNRW
jgi:hypothetical protein